MLGGDPNQAALLKDKRIRIITISEIRYEGTLYQINTKDKTIALKNVVAFGTEDRKVDQAIPPSQNVYEVIIFKASHIKDINVLTQEEEQRAQVANPTGPPMGKETPPNQDTKETNPQRNKSYERDDSPRETESKYRGSRRNKQDDDDEYEPKTESNYQGKSSHHQSSYGDRGYSGHNNYRKEPYNSNRDTRREKGPKDFDFDEMVEKNNLLEKEKEKKEEREEVEAKYNPDDFFDTVSTSVNEKPDPSRKDPYHLYKTNNETFGFQKRPNQRGGRNRGNGSRGGYSRGGDYDNRDKGGYYGRSNNYDRDRNYETKDRDQYYSRGSRGGSGYNNSGNGPTRRGGRGGRGGFADDHEVDYEKKH